MFSGWSRTIYCGGLLGFLLTCGLLASRQSPVSRAIALSTAQISPQATFAAPPLYSVAGSEVGITGLTSMAKGGFNGDGILDFAAAGFACANGQGFPADSVAVYLGNGDGTFKPPVYYAAGPCPYQVLFADRAITRPSRFWPDCEAYRRRGRARPPDDKQATGAGSPSKPG